MSCNNYFRLKKYNLYKFSKFNYDKSFLVYIKLNQSVQKITLKPHYTFASFFIKNTGTGTGYIFNIQKFFKKFSNIVSLVCNLFYYRIQVLAFGPSFLKNEVLSLNWLVNNVLKTKLRLTHVTLFHVPFNNSFYGIRVLKFFKKLFSINTACILDINQHRVTLTSLNSLSIFVFGPVPVIYNSKDFDLTLPVTNESIFLQHFFLKLIIGLRRGVEFSVFSSKYRVWSNFLGLYK
jgi:hypothetical protein